mmetsp:Transcript_11616/g.32308  ORF Transcript_11616/g.32308 Transcript_11616/m.32308 type:complete len:272 (+) Transcript_11616:313-1128(+)
MYDVNTGAGVGLSTAPQAEGFSFGFSGVTDVSSCLPSFPGGRPSNLPSRLLCGRSERPGRSKRLSLPSDEDSVAEVVRCVAAGGDAVVVAGAIAAAAAAGAADLPVRSGRSRPALSCPGACLSALSERSRRSSRAASAGFTKSDLGRSSVQDRSDRGIRSRSRCWSSRSSEGRDLPERSCRCWGLSRRPRPSTATPSVAALLGEACGVRSGPLFSSGDRGRACWLDLGFAAGVLSATSRSPPAATSTSRRPVCSVDLADLSFLAGLPSSSS